VTILEVNICEPRSTMVKLTEVSLDAERAILFIICCGFYAQYLMNITFGFYWGDSVTVTKGKTGASCEVALFVVETTGIVDKKVAESNKSRWKFHRRRTLEGLQFCY
jgi:hypothetical protein